MEYFQSTNFYLNPHSRTWRGVVEALEALYIFCIALRVYLSFLLILIYGLCVYNALLDDPKNIIKQF